MDDDELRSRLAATDLTTPGITLDEAVRRAAKAPRSRRPSWTLRLAVTAVAVWIVVFALQAVVERGIGAIVPPGPGLVADGAAPSLLLQQKLLLAELVGNGAWFPDEAEPSPREVRPAVPEAADGRKTSSLLMRGWSRV